MDLSPFEEAFDLLLRLGLAYLFFGAARRMTAMGYQSKWRPYAWALVAAIVLAWASWATYGTHVEDEDSDPIYGGGVRVTDFEPSKGERNHHGLFTFGLLSVLFVLGANRGIADNPTGVERRI